MLSYVADLLVFVKKVSISCVTCASSLYISRRTLYFCDSRITPVISDIRCNDLSAS